MGRRRPPDKQRFLTLGFYSAIVADTMTRVEEELRRIEGGEHPSKDLLVLVAEVRLLREAISAVHARGCSYGESLWTDPSGDFCTCDLARRRSLLRRDRGLGEL